VRVAEDLSGVLGTPFAPLPEGLLSPVRVPVSPETIEPFSRAGEGIRNLDVHLGKGWGSVTRRAWPLRSSGIRHGGVT